MKYDVTMKTQLGDRYGVLELEEARPEVKGVLRILGRETVLKGSMTADGKCRLEGMLQTLMHTTPFTADGVISACRLDLLLHGRHGAWVMTGRPSLNDIK